MITSPETDGRAAFVPLAAGPASDDAVARLVDFLTGRRVAVLTGAGCSTESGIPDYRGPETSRRARNPIQYRAFVREPLARARYWSRSLVGWPRIQGAAPNDAHRALAGLERRGVVSALVTQNVDRLHAKAGSAAVVELHGALAEVVCLSCGSVEPRDAFQQRLLDANPDAHVRPTDLAPDGDAELPGAPEHDFVVPACEACAGVLKPHVVFFGENVPARRVEAATAAVSAADALLVVGTSLAVFSGYRFVRQAAREGRPVAIVNVGPTRGDHAASVRLDAIAGELLPRVAAALGA